MAQFNKDTQGYIDGRRVLHDVNMIANKNGDIVSSTNRLPVDAQITSAINIITVEEPGDFYAINNHATNANRKMACPIRLTSDFSSNRRENEKNNRLAPGRPSGVVSAESSQSIPASTSQPMILDAKPVAAIAAECANRPWSAVTITRATVSGNASANVSSMTAFESIWVIEPPIHTLSTARNWRFNHANGVRPGIAMGGVGKGLTFKSNSLGANDSEEASACSHVIRLPV